MLVQWAKKHGWGRRPLNGEPSVSKDEVLTEALSHEQLAERRTERRYATNDVGMIHVMFLGMRQQVKILDVSRSGLGIELETPLARGLRVSIELPKQMLIFGEVRYCRCVGNSYQAGIKIDDVFATTQPGAKHIKPLEFSLYRAGKGLSVADVMRLREHLLDCEACRKRLGEADANSINPEKLTH